MGEDSNVTRRALLGGIAAAGAASLVRPATGLAGARSPQRPPSALWVGSVSGETPPITAPTRFALVGIEWSGPAAPAIGLRARAPDGHWSPWAAASVLGHEPDGRPRGETLFGEPLWTGAADRVQLRSSDPVHAVRVHFIAPAPPQAAHSSARSARALPVLDAGPGQPPIIARQGWGARQARPVHAPEYGTVKLAFVHHTVNPNGYSAGEVPAMLLGIFQYHVQVRGYWDIAYNFVIDSYGRIWEGRGGGIDMAVIGAHAGAYNAHSTGISLLGDFGSVEPSPAAIDALERLLAWKLSLHGVPSQGDVTVVVDPAGAHYTPFPPGARVSLPRVAGHRDGDSTDCPGNALYAQLPSIRPRVDSLAGTPARITIGPLPALMSAGTVTVAGRLALLSGEPLAGVPIELQQPGGAGRQARTFATATTGADGSWSAAVALRRNVLLRALHRLHPATVADWIPIAVAPAIAVAIESSSPLQLSGTISPSKRHITVELHRGGVARRKPLASERVTAAGGRFGARVPVPGPGSYVLVVRSQADASNAAGESPPVSVTVQ